MSELSATIPEKAVLEISSQRSSPLWEFSLRMMSLSHYWACFPADSTLSGFRVDQELTTLL
jgi:hypothetical protein